MNGISSNATLKVSQRAEKTVSRTYRSLERLVSLLFWRNGRIEISSEEVIDDQEEKVEEQESR